MKKQLIILLTAFTLLQIVFISNTSVVDASDGTWNLVTDVNDLEAGDTIVIAAKDANYTISTT